MLHQVVMLALALAAVPEASQEALTVLNVEPGSPAPSETMHEYLRSRAHEALDRRAEAFEGLLEGGDVLAHQERQRAFFIEQIGGLPERTPLNARTVEARQCEGYRLEKVIYESRPQFYVTAALFLPLTPPPHPGVLVPCGHSDNGKAKEHYQRAASLLARNGFVALCYDPVDQGERYMLLDGEGVPRFGGTKGHTMMGVGCILLGTNTAAYRIWDGMRSLDYLASRPEVDPKRLGCTGNSGGGSLTCYLMALDSRVQCAAPSCHVTSFNRLIDTQGPGDAEQNIFNQIAFGMERGDYPLMRAPKPTLICCATRDFFDIQGTWDVFREAKRLCTCMGHPERIDLAEVDGPHAFHRLLREASVRWMRRWLLGIDDAITEEPDVPVLTEEEIQCTPDGQVMLIEGARSVYDLNAEMDDRRRAVRRDFWETTPKAEALAKVRQLIACRPLEELAEVEEESVGESRRKGYRIEKLILRPEPEIVLPALAFVPPKPDADAYLYCHGQGKHVDASPGGPIERLVREGHIVLAVDLRNMGETAAQSGPELKRWDGAFGPHWREFFLAYMLGKSYVGMRAEDILVSARFLQTFGGIERRVHLIAMGEAGPPALHAAALEPDCFASLRLERSLKAWSLIVHGDETQNQLINAVHQALRFYDLPDLEATLPPGMLTIVEPVDERGEVCKAQSRRFMHR